MRHLDLRPHAMRRYVAIVIADIIRLVRRRVRNEPSAGACVCKSGRLGAYRRTLAGLVLTSEPDWRGLIDFTLSSSGERASGDVLMIAEGIPALSVSSVTLRAILVSRLSKRHTHSC